MSKGQTTKKAGRGISVEEMPFTAKEKKVLKSILSSPHWARRKMKDEFINEYGRPSKDVDAYIMANRKRRKKKVVSEDNSEPKPKVRAKLRSGEPLVERSRKPAEL